MEVPSQGVYVARSVISSTLRFGFLASFSSVSKYLTDWDICNEAYGIIADEGDISFQLQVLILLMKCLDYFTIGPMFPELVEVFVIGVWSVVGMGSLELNCGT